MLCLAVCVFDVKTKDRMRGTSEPNCFGSSLAKSTFCGIALRIANSKKKKKLLPLYKCRRTTVQSLQMEMFAHVPRFLANHSCTLGVSFKRGCGEITGRQPLTAVVSLSATYSCRVSVSHLQLLCLSASYGCRVSVSHLQLLCFCHPLTAVVSLSATYSCRVSVTHLQLSCLCQPLTAVVSLSATEIRHVSSMSQCKDVVM